MNVFQRHYLESGDHSNAILKRNGREFWIGAVSLLDGHIEEVYPYEVAKNADFHHSFYFSKNAIQKLHDEEWGIFWIDKNKQVVTWDSEINSEIISKIKEQIKI